MLKATKREKTCIITGSPHKKEVGAMARLVMCFSTNRFKEERAQKGEKTSKKKENKKEMVKPGCNVGRFVPTIKWRHIPLRGGPPFAKL